MDIEDKSRRGGGKGAGSGRSFLPLYLRADPFCLLVDFLPLEGDRLEERRFGISSVPFFFKKITYEKKNLFTRPSYKVIIRLAK